MTLSISSAPMLLAFLVCCAGLADAQTFDSCTALALALPPGCTCSAEAAGANVQCSQSPLGVTLATGLAIQPCVSPAQIVFTIQVGGEPWTHTITAGQSGTVPIPGLYWSVGVASFGAVLQYELEGNAESLDVKIGIDACGEVLLLGYTCLSDTTPAVFPVQLLDTTLDFGACPPTTTAPTGSPVADASRGYVQISTASQHCPSASRTSMEYGYDDDEGREDCYRVCRDREGCLAFSWNPVETGSGRQYCMTCSSTNMGTYTTDNSDRWESYAIVFSEPPTTSVPTTVPTTSAPTTSEPSVSPSISPTTSDPSVSPSISPTASDPTALPSTPPTTSDPTASPSTSPTTSDPTASPSTSPATSDPTMSPSTSPTTSDPTANPTANPTPNPAAGPTSPSTTTAPPTPPPTASAPTVATASSKELELTFPGDLDTITPANQDAIKDAIETNVEAELGAGTVERVELSALPADSFQATVTFTDSVTAAQIDGLGTMYTDTPMIVSAGGGTMTSVAASTVDTAAGSPSSSSDDGISGGAVAGIVVALLLVAVVIGAVVYRQRKAEGASSSPTTVPSIHNAAHVRPLERLRGSVTDVENNLSAPMNVGPRPAMSETEQ